MKYKLYDAEMREAAALLQRHETATADELAQWMDVRKERTREILMAICAEPMRERVGNGGFRHRYRLAPDYLERIRTRTLEQDDSRRLVSRAATTPPGDVFPTGDPTHFDVDWLGRVIYRGPVVAKDSRFDGAAPDADFR